MYATIFRSKIKSSLLTFLVDDKGVKNFSGKEQHPDHEGIKCKQSARRKQTENLHLSPLTSVTQEFPPIRLAYFSLPFNPSDFLPRDV